MLRNEEQSNPLVKQPLQTFPQVARWADSALTRIVINEHAPEQCGQMERDLDKLPDRLRGLDFLCTCPGSRHGYFMVYEGDSAEDVLQVLPDSLRMGSTRALPLEIFKL